MEINSLAHSTDWVALASGNSRLHWALFNGDRLQQTWHSPHVTFKPDPSSLWTDWQALSPAFQQLSLGETWPELWVASVVPSQTQLWQTYPNARILKLANVPLQNLYLTLGLDRVIALWGSGTIYGWPVLVIDAGTALTLTGGDADGGFVGGAILPGLGLQLRSLHEETAALPPVPLPVHLPEQWAKDTETAIQSGILYTAIAGLNVTITQWCAHHPNSRIIFTGGDATTLATYFRAWQPQTPVSWIHNLILDEHLLWQAISALRQQILNPPESKSTEPRGIMNHDRKEATQNDG